jgi:hypothetical protein
VKCAAATSSRLAYRRRSSRSLATLAAIRRASSLTAPFAGDALGRKPACGRLGMPHHGEHRSRYSGAASITTTSAATIQLQRRFTTICLQGDEPLALRMRAANKTLLTVLALSLALFGVTASTTKSGAQEWEQAKLGFFNGNDVHSWCQSDSLMALGYTAGVWDQSARTFADLSFQRGYSAQVDAAISWEKEMIFGYCEPPHVTAQQVTDVFCHFLRDRPEKRSAPASLLFAEAMRNAWPCKKP